MQPSTTAHNGAGEPATTRSSKLWKTHHPLAKWQDDFSFYQMVRLTRWIQRWHSRDHRKAARSHSFYRDPRKYKHKRLSTITTSRCRLIDLVTLLSLTQSPGTQAWDTGFIWVLVPVQSVQSVNLTCVSPSKGNFLWVGNMFYSFITWPSPCPCPISSPRSTNPAHSQDFKSLRNTISSKDGKHY